MLLALPTAYVLVRILFVAPSSPLDVVQVLRELCHIVSVLNTYILLLYHSMIFHSVTLCQYQPSLDKKTKQNTHTLRFPFPLFPPAKMATTWPASLSDLLSR